MRITRHVVSLTVVSALGLLAWSSGCGSHDNKTGPGSSLIPSGNAAGSLVGDGGGNGAAPQCTQAGACVSACSSGTSTTISGTVYDPAGHNPLYGIAVYVPSQAVSPIMTGASCYSCGDLYSGGPIASDLTDAAGKFTIKNAPDGPNIPLVIQVGKWRKQLTVQNVTPCTDNPLPDKSLRLPKNQTEGDIPSIAIATGGADTLECLLGRIGIDASEYTGGPGGQGRIHIFTGDGGATTAPRSPPGTALWASQATMMPYDVTILSCEGHETTQMNQQSLFDYAAAGGRVFASHFHYAWFNSGPFGAAMPALAAWQTGTQSYGGGGGRGGGGPSNINAVIQTTLPTGGPFVKGQAMKDWLGNVRALTAGELPITNARHNALVTVANTPSTPWIVADALANPPSMTEYFSFDTPLGGATVNEKPCGRVVYSDLHVSASSGDYGANQAQGGGCNGNCVVPKDCANMPLSPQEDALEFMLFDLSACLTPVNTAPPKPGLAQ